MANINSYIHFNGNAEEAFQRYQSLLGGTITALSRYSDTPPGTPTHEGTDPNQIMHISLDFGNGCALMASDLPPAFGPGTRGDMAYLSFDADSRDDAARIFNGLSEGGQVLMPLDDTFWGAYFGMCVDRYGVRWMINHAQGH